ncbi:MAG: TIGR03862 family flavoprotein, partial [Parvularcula sp.]
DAAPPLLNALTHFDRRAVCQWMDGLGIESFEGPTGRIFPKAMKASPLLRAWLNRLADRGVTLSLRHRFIGWNADGDLCFQSSEGLKPVAARATILALGGASWSRLGSDGRWATLFEDATVAPFTPSNCGFIVPWSSYMSDHHAGAAIKAVTTSIGGKSSRAEFVITRSGVESGAIYQLSREILDTLDREKRATLTLNLAPGRSEESLKRALEKVPTTQSLSNRLRRAARLSPPKIALLLEGTPRKALTSPDAIARAIRSTPLTITAPAPLDEAISTRGGVRWDALDERFMVRDRPGVFCAGEMVDWDAPTGGYLLTACLATGRAAADGLHRYLRAHP